MTYEDDYAMRQEEENLEYQGYFRGYVDELTFVGHDEVAAHSLARQLALKAMKGQSFNEAETNALLGIESASSVDFDI